MSDKMDERLFPPVPHGDESIVMSDKEKVSLTAHDVDVRGAIVHALEIRQHALPVEVILKTKRGAFTSFGYGEDVHLRCRTQVDGLRKGTDWSKIHLMRMG